MGKVWTKEEFDFLKHNYKTRSYGEIAKELNKTRSSIQSKCSKSGLIKDEASKVIYRYNSTVFKNIDTEEKAYWLGFISADGCVSKKSDGAMRLKIALKRDDKNHLEKFAMFLDSNLKVKDKISKCKGKEYPSSLIVVNSTELCTNLISLGVTPNKSYSIRVPNISEDLMRHYIRGFYDGDGCYYIKQFENRMRYSIELVGASLGHIKDVQNYLINNNIKTQIYEKKKGNWTLLVSSKKNCLAFIDLIYSHNTINLERKNQKVNEFIELLNK